MFKITQSSDYTWPVTVETPTDGGRTEKSTFDAKFKRLNQTRIDEIKKSVEAGEMRDADLAREVLIGWSGITDEGGEVPFSDGAREKLLEVPMLATAIVMALLNSISGAKRKN